MFETDGVIHEGYTIYSENAMPDLNYDDYAPIKFIMPEVREAFPQLRNTPIQEHDYWIIKSHNSQLLLNSEY